MMFGFSEFILPVMVIIGLLITLILLIFGITVISNLIFFPRLKIDQVETTPFVSVLVPARDEAQTIAQTVKHVLAQTYPSFEVYLLDDLSTDGTTNIASQAAQGDRRFHLLRGAPPPKGWLGKNWACHQMANIARGDLLLFLDADVLLHPSAITALVALITQENAGLLAVWPTQITSSWSERLVVPLMAFAILAYLPVLPVHFTPWPAFAAANGQCLLFKHSTYQDIGGHAAVRDHVVDDVALARRVKARHPIRRDQKEISMSLKDRFRRYFQSPLRMADGSGLVCCQMYPGGWLQVSDGFSKNILSGHNNSVLLLLLSTILHWLVFIFPWVWLFFGGGWWAFALSTTGITLRALTAAFTHQRVRDALLMPISVVLMTWIALRAIMWHYTGSATWKGRKLQVHE